MLKRLIESKPIVKILEAHNGITGLIVEKTKVGYDEFDGMWLSSLTHSASKGKPDTQYVDITTVSQTLGEILLKKLRPKDQVGPFGVFHNHHMFDITQNFWDTEF